MNPLVKCMMLSYDINCNCRTMLVVVLSMLKLGDPHLLVAALKLISIDSTGCV